MPADVKAINPSALILTLALLLSLFLMAPTPLQANERFTVAFINPDNMGNRFWDKFTLYMQGAARSLDIDLDVRYANGNRYSNYETAEAILKSRKKPDYLVYVYQLGLGKRILELAEQHKVPTFIVNTDVHIQDKPSVGLPRQQFSYWIGHLFPDDQQAGSTLADYLINEAKSRFPHTPQQPIDIFGLSGSRDSSPGLERNIGLQNTVENAPLVRLNQIVFTDWDASIAAQKSQILLQRYPLTKVIWSASDDMALATRQIQAFEQASNAPVIGGIDWTPLGFEAIQNGKLNASVGGHFQEGAWVLLMLYDYHQGKDFADLGVQFKSHMQLAHRDNILSIKQRLKKYEQQEVDYSQFSRVENPDLNHYPFMQRAEVKKP